MLQVAIPGPGQQVEDAATLVCRAASGQRSSLAWLQDLPDTELCSSALQATSGSAATLIAGMGVYERTDERRIVQKNRTRNDLASGKGMRQWASKGDGAYKLPSPLLCAPLPRNAGRVER